jgi:superfamily II DNA or RNA helicase
MKHTPGTFKYIEAKIRAESKNTEHGFKFEKICTNFLSSFPNYKNKFKNIWLWHDWPDRWTNDNIGIDIVAETIGGKLWAVQAKMYKPQYYIKEKDINSFLVASNNGFSYRLIIYTGRLERRARKLVERNQKQTPIGEITREDLLATNMVWPKSVEDVSKPLPPLTPDDHQKKAIKDVLKRFKRESKGQLIMACGTGKTLTSIKIAEELKAKRILILVPSLNLIAQSIKDWNRNYKKDFSISVVCSEKSLLRDRGKDSIVLTTAELGLPISPTYKELRKFLKNQSAKPKVVFSTYQSSDDVEKAQKMNCPKFDLVIADEAHRCAGIRLKDAGKKNLFGLVIDDKKIKSKKKLFMTATPRWYSDRVQKKAMDFGLNIISMCDKNQFGDVFHKLKFSKAIKDKILSDYQVVIIGVSKGKEQKYAMEGRYIKLGKGSVTDATTVASQVGLSKAIKDYSLQKIITFHSSIKRARLFGEAKLNGQSNDLSFERLVQRLPKEAKTRKEFKTTHIAGDMPAWKRLIKLRKLDDMDANTVGVISNCRCLGEGVDVPSLDGVAFIDPKFSEIEIIQATGRAIRKSDKKKLGTIFIPVFIEKNEKDADKILASSAFKPVWSVVRALRTHDDKLSDELDDLRISFGQKTKLKLSKKIKIKLPANISISQFQKAFTVKLVERTTGKWDAMIRLLTKYKQRYGHFDPPKKMTLKWKELFDWIHVVRLDYRSSIAPLPKERVDELNELDFSWRFSGQTLDCTDGLLNEAEFMKKSGLSSIPKYRESGLIKPVGRGIAPGNLSWFYHPKQIEELKKKLKITLKNTKGLLSEKEFSKKSGLTGISGYRKQELIKPAGRAIFGGSFSYFYHPQQIEGLKKKLGITLKNTNSFLSEQQFAEKFGVSNATMRSYRNRKLVTSVGQAVCNGVLTHFYRPIQVKKLRKKLGITLTDTQGLLSETEFMEKSGFTRIINYREQGLIEPAGIYVVSGKKGTGYFYHPRQIGELRKELGITLPNTKGLLNEKELAKKVGLARVKIYREQGKIDPAGFAMSGRHVTAYYKPKEIKKLRNELGITLSDTKGLFHERDFAKKAGLSLGLVQRCRKEGQIKPFGTAFMGGPMVSFCYHPRQIKELKRKLKK